ncbi:hypothetical protein L484_013970 [Morus notabilis]|uniref:Uncharacterized protein n=1 Tax=Morus notabilis TaxID=981085 RepID=W9R4B4_9ROSA|nr:hypothetical protein L484_013970 [Morus notabilis]
MQSTRTEPCPRRKGAKGSVRTNFEFSIALTIPLKDFWEDRCPHRKTTICEDNVLVENLPGTHFYHVIRFLASSRKPQAFHEDCLLSSQKVFCEEDTARTCVLTDCPRNRLYARTTLLSARASILAESPYCCNVSVIKF